MLKKGPYDGVPTLGLNAQVADFMRTPSPSPPRVSWKASLGVAILAMALLIPAGLAAGSGGNGTVQGFITSAPAGTPIAGASVQFAAADLARTFRATTDGSGHYAFSVPNHLYTVTVSSPAYYLSTTSLRVGSGQMVWLNMSMNLAASRSAHLQGYVKDSVTSAAVTVGRIVVAPPSWASGALYANASGMNASGFYRMNVTPGTYQLTTDGILNYTPYSYSYLYLNAGQVSWLNISLTPNPLVSWINGTIEDAGNYTHLAGATITASTGGLQIASTTSNATGGFSIRVPVATIFLVGDASGYAPGTANVYVYWAGSFSATLALLPLTTGVRGYVRDGVTGAGIPGTLIAPTPIFSGGYYDQAVTDAFGSFAIPLPPDDYSISITMTGYTSWYSYIFLSAGTVSWTNVTLWPLVSTVKGYLTDGTTGNPVTSVGVYAYDARSGYGTSALSGASGLFSLTLPPTPAITLTVTGYAPYAGTVAYIATRPYATTWVNLSLARVSAPLRATVTDGITGLPISGATLSVSWQLGLAYGTTNASGLSVVNVATGLPLTVAGWASGYLTWSGTMAPVVGSADVAIQLVPNWAANVTVKGYVQDAASNASLTFVLVRASGFGSYAPADYTDGTGFYQITTVTYPQTVRVTAYGYAAGVASINPSAGATIWLNFSLSRDTVAPLILNFTATPSTNLGPSNPSSLVGRVNESNFDHAALSILMLRSTAAGIGTFLNLGPLPAWNVTVSHPAPGNETISASWNTRTPAALLSDGLSSDWWPATMSYLPYQVALTGYWTNATLGTSTVGTAYFDSRSGNLLYVYTVYGFITAQDQPASTFQPLTTGLQVNLATSAVVGSVFVTGSTFQLGGFHLMYASAVPGGQYAALLETYDAAWNYGRAVALMQVTADTSPPTALAGPDQVVDQGAVVTLSGTGSSDNTGVVNYTWTFTDGIARVLYGAVVTHRFLNAGTYVVTLTVWDAAGNHAADTLTVTVRDTTAPTVSFSAPSESANVSGSVLLVTVASDNLGVVRVEFLVDGVAIGNATSAPFQLSLNTVGLSNGAHTLTAIAFDAAGNSATATRHVTVYNTPGAGNGNPLGLDTTTWVLLLVLLVAAAVGVVLVLMRRRRPRQPVRVPPGPPPSS